LARRPRLRELVRARDRIEGTDPLALWARPTGAC
jgi:hypothetical protein